MMNNNQYSLTLVILILGLVASQNIFCANSTAVENHRMCRNCHNNHKNTSFKISISDRHHYLYGSEILHSTAPNSETDNDGLYDCSTCHISIITETGTVDIKTERDCLQCHLPEQTNLASRHHKLVNANDMKCFDCHYITVTENGGTILNLR